MQLDVWHITGDGFHWGRHGLGQEESGWHMPSDSVWAALFARLVDLHGAAAAQTWAAQLQSDAPPLALTSALPRAGQVLFFPTPLRLPTGALKMGVKAKKVKRAKLVSEKLFREILSGDALADVIDQCIELNGGTALVSKDEWAQLPDRVQADRKVWDVGRRPNVVVGRGAHNSQLYFTGRTMFHPGCGLWLGVRWLQAEVDQEKRLTELMLDWGEAGMGGERSRGYGRFTAVRQPDRLELPDARDGLWVTLSRYLPRADETSALRDERAAYLIENVGGWIDSPVSRSQRRRAVRLLAEGAVLGPVARRVPGQMVDARPIYSEAPQIDHPVWRSGLAVAVGVSDTQKGGSA
jgi:CRISPR type III-A-associated RAMP protein Csm4